MSGQEWNAGDADLADATILAAASGQVPRFPVIGLAGPQYSGKSTAAKALAGVGFERLRFAAPLKAAFRGLLAELCVAPDRIERMIEGDLKEVPAPELSHRTPRHAMRTLGTEWGRDLMAPDFWVSPMIARASDLLARGVPVAFEDVRFPNEAAAVRALGGIVVMIEGRGGSAAAAHASESFAFEADAVIDNSGCLERLEAQALEIALG
ncbi:deoxynucleotide monophosphate kinase [Rhodovulum marinum]|uniref:Dephospho-CoA kinase n=1 Tax=Rhodovulum marinum TaxID=320662 RepID=A0A4R2Q5Z3_9RHOB|nr:deoxynucleotide monophosphate kinase [Rhodovulum marinum]TCP43919.1 hypothetical protein EV662_1012 [Rhodovulum marinum]